MAHASRGNKAMLHRLAPYVVKEHISHIELADLHRAHRYNPDENETPHLGPHGRKFGEEADGQESHDGPEEDFEKGKHVPLGHDPILEDKRFGFDPLIAQKR